MIPSSRQQEIDAEQRAWSPGRAVKVNVHRCNMHNDCHAATEHAAQFGYEVQHCTRECGEDCVGEECT